MSCGVGCRYSSDPAIAVASAASLIQPLAWKHLYTTVTALEGKKKKKKKKRMGEGSNVLKKRRKKKKEQSEVSGCMGRRRLQ